MLTAGEDMLMDNTLIARATERMIEYLNGDVRDVNHFIKVHAFAALIGNLEGLDERTLIALELAAIVHDIACPLCRLKYGSADGKLQEREGPRLARELLGRLDVDGAIIERVCDMVGRHHTYTGVDGIDLRILLEADFLVNAHECSASREAIVNMLENVFETDAGRKLLRGMYLQGE